MEVDPAVVAPERGGGSALTSVHVVPDVAPTMNAVLAPALGSVVPDSAVVMTPASASATSSSCSTASSTASTTPLANKTSASDNGVQELGNDEVLVDVPTSEVFHIQCDACQNWYVATELDPPLSPESALLYETWHCEDCIPYHGPSQLKRSRSGLRKRRKIDFVKLNDPGSLLEHENGSHIGVAANDVQEVDFKQMIRQRQNRGMFKAGLGPDGCLLHLPPTVAFDLRYVNQHGFDQPVLIADKTPEQIGLRVPPPNADGTPFTFANVAKLVGPYRPIQVIDTATQLTTEYTLQEWVEYLETPSNDRTRVLNVITLEFSETPMGRLVTEPQFARDVDFVHLHWPKTAVDAIVSISSNNKSNAEDVIEELEELEASKPRVAKYCLMSAGGSYTDFHVDFGGTSVWYHLYRGTKIFYFIQPTPVNLHCYSGWATQTTKKKKSFLPDLIAAAGGNVHEIVLQQGQTLFIPSGWIHAVYTPFDSLVFGGNFIHRHSLEMQLGIYRLEKQMKVGKEYRFPNYQRLLWYAARDFLKECGGSTCSPPSPPLLPPPPPQQEQEQEQRKTQKLCFKYAPHILRGYKTLAKELERWSTSKARHVAEQHPRGVDCKSVSMELGRMMTKCVDYLDEKEKGNRKREREQIVKSKKKKEREKAKALAEMKRIERRKEKQARKEEADRKKVEREKKKAARLLERRKTLESVIDQISWAQCDKCNEWREVPPGVLQKSDEVEESSFLCIDVGLPCSDVATTWLQCSLCQAWRANPQESTQDEDDKVEKKEHGQPTACIKVNEGSGGNFTCHSIGEKCSAKKFQLAKLALSG